ISLHNIRKITPLVLLVLLSFALAQDDCPETFEKIGSGGCCYQFSVVHGGIQKDWSGAKASCRALGELLGMTIELAELSTGNGCCNDVELMNTIASKGEINSWVGGGDALSEGQYVWDYSGIILEVTNALWSHDSPAGGADENCVQVYSEPDMVVADDGYRASLNDQECSLVSHYVCQ
ncbi:unnamed protein product, partial [Meganyctiphanes norvegica]